MSAALCWAAALALALPTDSARAELTFDEFRRRVVAYHPVARQARLLAEQARADLRTARGGFDPTLSASWDRKTFGGAEYYDYVRGTLKLPTPLGADVKVGYERADGRYISPDRRTPAGGLVTAGLSIPVGQRVLTDERRTAVAAARALRDVAEADRAAAVNKLLLAAAKDYAAWLEASRRAAIVREGVALADFRLRATRSRVASGEAAPIDTVEALLELQRRGVQQMEAEQARYAAALAVSAHLWDERGAPVELPEGAAPSPADARPDEVAPDSAAVLGWVARAEGRHPDVLKATGRVEQARALRLFAGQQLLPSAEADVSALGAGGSAWPDGGLAPPFGAPAAGDLKAGVTLRAPLLFLAERGRAEAAALRLEQWRVEAARLRREVALGVRVAANDLAAAGRLLGAQRLTVAQARLLRDGEQRKLESGESTLFLVNARERLVLDEELKLAAIEAKFLAARAALEAAVGER